MNYPISILCGIVAITCCGPMAFGQAELQGSQYLFHKTYINPAYTGSLGDFSANMHFMMKDGVGNAKNSSTVSLAADAMLPGKQLGLGLNLIRSRFGNDSYTTVYLNAAYHLHASDELIIASGIAAGFQQFDIDLSQLSVVSPGDPAAGEGNLYSSKVDLRAGIYASYLEKFYVGLSFDNLTSVYVNRADYEHYLPLEFRRLNLYFNAGARVAYDQGLMLRPSLLILKTFGGATTIEGGTFLDISRNFSLGVAFRYHSQAMSSINDNQKRYAQNIIRPMLDINILKSGNLRMSYGYNINANRPGNLSAAMHDFALTYRFLSKY
ncbi:PorP/SprF family type IX secretion system membrane protein [Parapedobacter sp. 10938]|uniref:PorP/SprF family type IX secretion system membrane protein n=1 Tax=Parapedobacter flavus TaxID=3110225 RepID=UPI002DB637E2|nr:PorP/SprF family type IX secretion system membrane protein [Parapedobacter sp. 10938]MEC3881265.1 PorP/SprF family type IX secretion system membrane protein [Parapedobacter sp. 10938]